MPPDDIRTVPHPPITPDQLFVFYEKNDICEKGFGKEVAARLHASMPDWQDRASGVEWPRGTPR